VWAGERMRGLRAEGREGTMTDKSTHYLIRCGQQFYRGFGEGLGHRSEAKGYTTQEGARQSADNWPGAVVVAVTVHRVRKGERREDLLARIRELEAEVNALRSRAAGRVSCESCVATTDEADAWTHNAEDGLWFCPTCVEMMIEEAERMVK
jgi:hypothetical protein